jgi:hypothetical protein
MRPALPLVLALGACAPQLVPVEVAEAQCVRSVLSGGAGNPSLSLGIGTSSGNHSGLSTGIGLSTTFPVGSRSPAEQYDACVLRRSGQPPVTPFADRPELRG